MSPVGHIPPHVRKYFADLSESVLTLGLIDSLWAAEGFHRTETPAHVTGRRRAAWVSYEGSADWTDPGHILRILRVYQGVLARVPETTLPVVQSVLQGTRLRLDDRRLTWRRPPPTESLNDLRDPDLILDSFDRISRALPDDSAQAIGSAKELIEATAKTVLNELDVPFEDRRARLPDLISLTLQNVAVAPDAPDAARPVERIMKGLASIAMGVTELRNAGYGTGHATTRDRADLPPRCAALAIEAAELWCRTVLDAYADRPEQVESS